MFGLCGHHWTEQERIVVPSLLEMTGGGTMSEELFEWLITGRTTIVMRCSLCGDLKSIEVKGWQR